MAPKKRTTIANATIGAWPVDSGRKTGVTTDEHKDLVELRRRNRVLEMEIEIFKRAAAHFATENVLPK